MAHANFSRDPSKHVRSALHPEEAVRRNVMANGVSDVESAHGAHAVMMRATKSAEKILSQTPDLAVVQKNIEAWGHIDSKMATLLL